MGALSVGYFTGYFLLVCGEDPKKAWARSSPGIRLINRLMAVVVQVAVVAVPVALASKNLPLMRVTNGPALRHFSTLTEQALPEQSSVILSEDGLSLTLLAATLEAKGQPKRHILVNTQLLPFPAYQIPFPSDMTAPCCLSSQPSSSIQRASPHTDRGLWV